MPVVITGNGASSPVTATSLDGLITVTVDHKWKGVLIKYDYSAYSFTKPFTGTLYRQDSTGTYVVRGGDPLFSMSGYGYCYDHEAPLGAGVNYWIVPTDPTLPKSDGVGITTATAAGGFDDPGLWLKSPGTPEASMALVAVDTSQTTQAGRSTVAQALDAHVSVAALVERGGRTWQLTVLTSTAAQYDALQRLLNTKIVLVQSAPQFLRRDGWFLLGDAQPSRVSLATSSYYRWQIALAEVFRPATAGVTYTIPGQAFKDDGQDGTETNPETYVQEGATGSNSNLLGLTMDPGFVVS